jgi:hypothetical protein
MRAFLLVGVLAFEGCRAPHPSGTLPDAMFAVVRLEAGGYASTMMRLGRPGVEATVEVYSGMLAVGDGFIVGVSLGTEVDWDSQVRTRIDVELLGEGRQVSALVDGAVDVSRIEDDSVYLTGDIGALRMDLQDGVIHRLDHVPGQNDVVAEGPGVGFATRRNDSKLEVRLPGGHDDGWQPLMQGVDELVGAWWVSLASAPQWEKDAVDERFAQVGVLSAALGVAVADGDLREWRGTRALKVDLDRQVIDGLEYWDGPNDASFGVAARIDGGHIVMAVRVRDDLLSPDHDRIEVTLAERHVVLPIPGASRRLGGLYWSASFTDRSSNEVGVELDLAVGDLRPDRLALPLTVHYVDGDPGQGSTRLGTAASPSLVGVGFRSLPPN